MLPRRENNARRGSIITKFPQKNRGGLDNFPTSR